MKAEDYKFYSQFFEGNKRQYIIPVYQRNYDWTLEECKKLFDDIIVSFDTDNDHYIGSVIQVQKDEEHSIKPFIVIDGQQRLTTIYLLLTALLEFEENMDRQEVLKDSVFNNFRGEDPKEPHEIYKLKLKANTNDNIQLKNLMNHKFDEIDKSSNVFKNYEYFKELIREKLKHDYSPNDIKKGIEKLVCVVISLNEEKGDNPQVIFERINSTGLPLELDDLVRNYALMTELKQEELFDEYWSKIEKSIPKKNRKYFIINYLNAYTSYQVNEKNAYDVFKKWATNFDSNEDILKILSKFSKYYSAFIGNSYMYNVEIEEKLEQLRKLDQSTLYTFLFFVFDDLENNVIDSKTVEKILSFLVNYSVRRSICEIPSNSLRGLYKNLYKRVFDKVEKDKDYYDVFISFMLNELSGTRDEVPNNSMFKNYLQNTKLYRNRKLCGFLLGTLENYNSKEKIDVDSDKITIEHIMPRNFQNNEWRNSIGEEYERIYETYIDTLGNLTLTGYNSSLSDNAFKRKQELLESTGTKIAFLNKEFRESLNWNEEVIKIRSSRLADSTINIFKYPEYSGEKYHENKVTDQVIVDLDNAFSATGLIPKSFEFYGEIQSVESFIDLGVKFLHKLYQEDTTILQSLAIEKFRPWVPNSDRIYLSTESNDLSNPKKIEDSDIYMEGRLSAAYILEFIKSIIKKYDLDYSEFQVFCEKKIKDDN